MTDNKHCKECGQELTDFEISTAIEVCGECRFKATEEQHGSAQAELDQIREKARERRWKFMEKKKAEGSRQFSAIISKEAYDIMAGIRDASQLAGKPTSFGEIIEKALACYNNTVNESNIETTSVNSHETINTDKRESEHEPALKKVTETPVNLFEEPEPKLPTVGILPESDRPKVGTPEYTEWYYRTILELKKSMSYKELYLYTVENNIVGPYGKIVKESSLGGRVRDAKKYLAELD